MYVWLSNTAWYGITRDPFAGVTAPVPSTLSLVVAAARIAGVSEDPVLWFRSATRCHASIINQILQWLLLHHNQNHQVRPPTAIQHILISVVVIMTVLVTVGDDVDEGAGT